MKANKEIFVLYISLILSALSAVTASVGGWIGAYTLVFSFPEPLRGHFPLLAAVGMAWLCYVLAKGQIGRLMNTI
jgi:hypothetical protein